MHKTISLIAERAFLIPGVPLVELYELLGNYAEQKQDFVAAKEQYEKATLATTNQAEYENFQGHIKRISAKQKSKEKIVYAYKEE